MVVSRKALRMRLAVRSHPGSSRIRVWWDGTVLHVWVTARAMEGRANFATLHAVADALGVRPSAVTLVSGDKSRHKYVEIEGIDSASLDILRST